MSTCNELCARYPVHLIDRLFSLYTTFSEKSVFMSFMRCSTGRFSFSHHYPHCHLISSTSLPTNSPIVLAEQLLELITKLITNIKGSSSYSALSLQSMGKNVLFMINESKLWITSLGMMSLHFLLTQNSAFKLSLYNLVIGLRSAHSHDS